MLCHVLPSKESSSLLSVDEHLAMRAGTEWEASQEYSACAG
jgi:hypothetical protein